MPHRPLPPGITKAHVLDAIRKLREGVAHDFGPPTRWHLIHEGESYAPKAVIGLAAEPAFGARLRPADFSSGEGANQAVGYLRRLGFTVKPTANAQL